MVVDVIETAGAIESEIVKDKTVVIIDVLRATSVMVTALANGVKGIYPYKDIESVLENSKQCENSLLCGERKGLKIEGFDCGNSPLEYTPERVKDRYMYMTTSNGTRAIEKSAKSAKIIYIAAFLNIGAIVERLKEENNEDVIIVCSGTDDKFSFDDALCAGEIVRRLAESKNVKCTDIALALKFIAENSKGIFQTLDGCKHFEYLKTIGFEGDMEHCFSIDKYNIVPQYVNGCIKIK